ncbi:ketoreductase adrE [Trichoderma asperellum]|uniref:Ketoreductase adrE n=1 Tax=Trichoderma asperellum TaxID=101201 RepID=A0A6V8R2Q4_TRIAP|nr:NAD(P)-binding protein [Trichoderma asperelloides]GFP58820.1 ketoreductase adrE [Trichoderma asperellum]
MAPLEYSIPQGSLVLVTGANGYIGSHVVDQLLELGYNVRGTVRDKKPWLDEFFEKKYGKGRFESVAVKAIEEVGAFSTAADGASGVVHVASDVSFGTDPNKVIPIAVQGTLNALEAASKQTSVKRFVITSSSAAVLNPEPNRKGVKIDENTWNDSAVKLAWSDHVMEGLPKGFEGAIIYSASKTEAERAAWKWVEENKPNFVLNTVQPNFNFGQVLIPEHQSGSTMGFVRNFFKGDFSILTFPPQHYIDVKDCARLHVAGLLDPSVKNQRIFGLVHEFNWTDVLAILSKIRPELELPKAPENEPRDYTEVIPKDKAEKLLKDFFGQPGWTSLEDSLKAGLADL